MKGLCVRHKNREVGNCTKGFPCVLLGECVYGHPLVKDNAEAKYIIRSTKSVRQTCLAVIRAASGKAQKRPSPNLQTKKEHREPQPKGLDRGEVFTIQEVKKLNELDPVTAAIRKARLKKVAEGDVKKGYAYQEVERENFHYE